MKKIFCILLASLLLITVAVSCADNKAEGQTTENTSEAVKTSVESTSTQEENPGETTTDDIGTTAVDTTEVGTTEADTAEPEETTAPDENIAVNPDENYAGSWVSYPDIASGSIYIKIVDPETIWFSYVLTKGPQIRATAIKQDGKYVFGEGISSDLYYSVYDINRYGNSKPNGYLVLADGKVTLKFNEKFEGGTFIAGLKTENILGRGEDAVDEVKSTLEALGWIDIKVEKYDIGEYKFGIGRYSDEHIPTDSILGTLGDLSVGVRVVYDREVDDWFTADVFYAHADGRVLHGDELKAFILNHGKTDFILPADDVDLLEYFK